MGIMLSEAGRGFSYLTQMGGEGAPWIGMSPFVNRGHIFQNIGDGTYFHSGALAVEAAVAACVNITYKILYNSAVAMTGGQRVEGALPVPELTRKLQAEGVRRTVVLAEDPRKYKEASLAKNAELRHRDELARTMRELELEPGVTVIIYDQQCAAEKRRLRTRGLIEEPTTRVVIHEEVCEGCGDCVRQSNCMSLYPVDTPLGPKMRVHQSSCNKDYSCLLGDCPSFVTVRVKPGTGLRRPQLPALPAIELPPPRRRAVAGEGYRILSPGIGGTGVVTVNAVLATAAMLDGLFVSTLDQTGLAQKGGAVVSHLTLSDRPIECSAKINAANADVILGFDLLGVAGSENLKCARPGHTAAVVNTAEIPIVSRKAIAGPARLADAIDAACSPGRNVFVDANRLAEGLFGSHLSANVFLTGVAWQAGLIPISIDAIERAFRLNGVEVGRNLAALAWGRKYYEDASLVESLLMQHGPSATEPQDWAARLERYQNRAYAQEFERFIARIDPELRDTVARNLYKLMANKDEYEVARLLTSREFEQRLASTWEEVESVEYHLHPPLLRALGLKKKLRLGSLFRPVLRIIGHLKFLRGTPLDPFGHSKLRRAERALVPWYRDLMEQVSPLVTPETLPLALEIAELPAEIRGYEQIRAAAMAQVRNIAEEKLTALAALARAPA
jgi:indolepyruvate ferredoxin oxidoreductase